MATLWCFRCEKKYDETGHTCFVNQPPVEPKEIVLEPITIKPILPSGEWK